MKHYPGKTYDLTQKNMNDLIQQLEEKQSTVSFEFANNTDNKWYIECHMKAVDAQMVISDVLNEIRGRLKYNRTSKAEREFLEQIRSDFLEVYVEG